MEQGTEVPTDGNILTSNDVLKVFEELLPAQNQSYELGLKLNLPPHEVESIHSTYIEPGKRLLQVIIQFLNQLEPRPTWRVIVDALKSPVVNLPQLGKSIEKAHILAESISTCLNEDPSSHGQFPTPIPPQTSTSHSAPSIGDILGPNDAVQLLEELLPAQNQSYELGLKLNLQPHQVESIHSTFTEPSKRLLRVVIQFLNQLEPRPTWRAIVDALKSPVVNLPQLGGAIEEVHFSHTASTSVSGATIGPQSPVLPSISPQPMPSASEPVTEASLTEVQRLPNASSGCMTHQYVQTMIASFEKWFNELKKATRECLEKRNISVNQIADALTSLPADDVEEHKVFLESHLSALYQAPDHSQLFGTLNLNWNYMSYQLLDHLIKEFDLDTRNDMESYKQDLQMFREKTPLSIFCDTQKKKWVKRSPEFKEVVAKFEWPQNVTLEVVEQFRQAYANHYNLRECAIMLAGIRPGSFIVTWYIPASVVYKLKADIPEFIFKKYSVTNLEIAGVYIFSTTKPTKRAAPSYAPTEAGTATQALEAIPLSKSQKLAPESNLGQTGETNPQQSWKSFQTPTEDYLFVKKPSDDYFCPVTFNLLLKPNLTLCCGKHLSEECAIRIQEEGGPCPLCKAPDWSTVLNKHFYHKVNSLLVFCRHHERGCWWKGILSDFEHHFQSCPFRLLEDYTQGRTELHDVAEKGDVVAVRKLLKTSININSRTGRKGDTALHLACKRGYFDVVQELVSAHAIVNVVDKTGRTPLFWASSCGYMEIVELLLQNAADLSICSEDTLSPLYAASQEGYTDIVDALVNAGADVNQPYTKEPCGVPLTIASGEGHIKTVQRLVEAGATVNYKDKFGQTPILHASRDGHGDVVQLLIDCGADISENGGSPLYTASQEGHADVVDILLKCGACVNETFVGTGGCPLAVASQEGHAETVQRLLQAGATVNHQNDGGSTALLYAAMNGHLKVVKLLLEAGARDIPNKLGFTAVIRAKVNNHNDVVQCLLEYQEK